ncbi:hypothetical protein M405DRAFT_813091 [Rhizopogon salebrosus TDB-379]|nr:hypothetical protein M405DRAFT_813091 [Rhizopogon salebrosus TDB-379]
MVVTVLARLNRALNILSGIRTTAAGHCLSVVKGGRKHKIQPTFEGLSRANASFKLV